MKYNFLGNTGIQVSCLCMGTMTFGREADEAASRAMFNQCRDAGINFFDCANVYSKGRAELILGELISDCRDDLIVMAIKSNDIFRQPFLKKLAKLHHTLEDKLDHIDEVNSMVNARNTYGVEGGIVVEDLLEKWPKTEKESSEDPFPVRQERKNIR